MLLYNTLHIKKTIFQLGSKIRKRNRLVKCLNWKMTSFHHIIFYTFLLANYFLQVIGIYFSIIYSPTKKLLKNSSLYTSNQCKKNIFLINLKYVGCLCIAVYYMAFHVILSFLLICSFNTEHIQDSLSKESLESPFFLFCHNTERCYF